MSEIEDYIREQVRAELYKRDRWLFDCMVCGEPHHEGPCTRTDWPEWRGIE